MTPLVSISCITYNHAPYIKDALEGFVSQKTDFPFEVLIHDDCSTDGTTDIIREYATRYPDIIKPIFEDENQYSLGKPIGTMVWNLPRARGKYIAFCEGDDYWCNPHKLQIQVDFLESNPDYGMVYAKVNRFNQDEQKFAGQFGGKSEKFEELAIANTIPTPTVLIRKDIIHNFLRDAIGSNHYMMSDFPLWLFAAATSKIKFQEEVMATYRVIKGSASHPESIAKWLKFQKSLRDIEIDFINRFDPNNDALKSQANYMFMKNVLRQRTLVEPSLKSDAQDAINALKIGMPKKIFFHILNRVAPVNHLLKKHLLENNRRNGEL